MIQPTGCVCLFQRVSMCSTGCDQRPLRSEPLTFFILLVQL